MTNDSNLILTLDHNRRNLELLGQFLGKAGYKTLQIASLEELDQFLASYVTAQETIKLALVDISGFDQRVWERCAHLQTKNIPLLIISPRQSAALQQESLVHGARGMLIKPLIVKELLKLIDTLITTKETEVE
jgi:DNA-binding response OmpR family regulator